MRFRVAPVAGRRTEHRVPGGAWCLELERGAQHGTRLGFDPIPDRLSSVPFDAPGASVPCDGAERFWIHWPDTLDATEPLELTAWTVPARYARKPGIEKSMPLIRVLAKGRSVGAGSITLGPFSNVPWDQLVTDRELRLSTGARLVGYFGFTGGGTAPDVVLRVQESSGGTFDPVKITRANGGTTLPATTWANSFDEPVPVADFRFDLNCAAGSTVQYEVYLLLGP